MRVDLVVPFEEKEQAKSKGARWDPARKTWYVIDPAELHVFGRWIPGIGGTGWAGDRLKQTKPKKKPPPKKPLPRVAMLAPAKSPADAEAVRVTTEEAQALTKARHDAISAKVPPRVPNIPAKKLKGAKAGSVAKTERKSAVVGPLVDCGCNVPPWEHCVHTRR
jgi:hypothetical protein